MPRFTTALFTGTILIVVLSQVFSRQVSVTASIAPNDLTFSLIFLFCASGLLISWLKKPLKRKRKDDSDSSDNNKKPPHDTAL